MTSQEPLAGSPLETLREQRERIRTEMGGRERVAALRAAGRPTARERIEAFVDPGSFDERGTFARSERPEDADTTPAEGKVGGHATVDGRPVTVLSDDITVKRASTSVVSGRKLRRLYEQALHAGEPFVFFGETGGARLPDALGAVGFASLPAPFGIAARRRAIPLVTAIVGESFGNSSLIAGLSDFVVQVRGSCLAVTSPRVIEVATREAVGMEELGGVDVGSSLTGQIDLAVESEQEAYDAIRALLSYLPPNAWTPTERTAAATPVPDPGLGALVPTRRSRAYDVRRVVRRVVDDGRMLELKPRFGRSLLTALARIDGHVVGVLASQPQFMGGVLTPDACDKATRLLCLCDAYDIPLVVLQDTPGFLVGTAVEHDRILNKAMLFLQALTLARVPKLTVVLRKAYGLAYYSLGGSTEVSDLLVAWPGAELSFMDPDVGANVLEGGPPGPERAARVAARAVAIGSNVDPREAAAMMLIDEVIDPADTRPLLARQLGRVAGRRRLAPHERPLAGWPTCW